MESEEEAEKRLLIEHALENPKTSVKVWRNLAVSQFGLVAGKYPFFHTFSSYL